MTSKHDNPALGTQRHDSLDDKLCFDVYATNLAFARLYAPLLEPHGLTYPQYLVLTLLWERDNQSMAELGRALSLRSNTLTPVLKRLASAALITRARDGADERLVRIALTSAGRDLRASLADVPECVEEATGLTKTEIRDLQRQLRRVRQHVVQN